MKNEWPRRHALLRALAASPVVVVATVDYPALSADTPGRMRWGWNLRPHGVWASEDIVDRDAYACVCGAHSEEMLDSMRLDLVIGEQVVSRPSPSYAVNDLRHELRVHVVPLRQNMRILIGFDGPASAGQVKLYGWRLSEPQYRAAMAEGAQR